MCNYERADGTIEHAMLSFMIKHLIEDSMNRVRKPLFFIFPELLEYDVLPECRRFSRNIQSIRDALQKILDARRQGESKSMIDGDLLSIILSDDLYRGNDEKTKDELTILFLAGNETVKISSTNTVC
jgi:cytochrome P450